MVDGDPIVVRLIGDARRQAPGALDRLLESYRNYLRLLARTGIDASLRGKADASDLVQETLIKAHQHFEQFQGQTEAELIAWLRRIRRGTWPTWSAGSRRPARARSCASNLWTTSSVRSPVSCSTWSLPTGIRPASRPNGAN